MVCPPRDVYRDRTQSGTVVTQPVDRREAGDMASAVYSLVSWANLGGLVVLEGDLKEADVNK